MVLGTEDGGSCVPEPNQMGYASDFHHFIVLHEELVFYAVQHFTPSNHFIIWGGLKCALLDRLILLIRKISGICDTRCLDTIVER